MTGGPDGGPPVRFMVGFLHRDALDRPAAGDFTFTITATDPAGNVRSKGVAYTVLASDTRPPETVITGGPALWSRERSVTFTWSGSDDAAPLEELAFAYRLDGGDWSAPTHDTSVTLNGLGDGPHTFALRAADAAGNVDPSPAIRDFGVDTAPPVLTITAPADQSSYLLKQVVTASWSASDPSSPGMGSGVKTASGTVASGSAFDTEMITTYDWVANKQIWRSFTITATDNAGNTATKTVSYRVIYGHGSEFLSPIDSDGNSCFKLNSTVPVKFQLKDAAGASAATAVASIDVRFLDGTPDGTDMEAVSTAAATTGTLFRWSGDQYIFNLSTKSLKAGDFRISAQLDDGTSISEKISLRK
jgi:hypothetical protein